MKYALLVLLIAVAQLAGQTLPTAAPFPYGTIPFFDTNGRPLSGGKVCTYAAGTNTPMATYTDSTGGTANDNPIILNSAGLPQKTGSVVGIYGNGNLYKITVRTAGSDGTCNTGSVIFTNDQIGDISLYLANYVKTVGSATLINYVATGTGGATQTVAAKLGQTVNVKDYGAKCDGATNDSTAVANALTAAAGGTVVFPVGTCIVNITLQTGQSIRGAGGATSFCANSDSCPTTLKDGSAGVSPVIAVANGANDVSIKDFGLKGTGSGAGDRGIYIVSGNDETIDNVGCNTFGHECILWSAGIGTRVTNSFGQNTLTVRQVGAYGGALSIGGTDGFFLNNEFTASVTVHSLSANCYNTGIYVPGSNNFIANSYGETSEVGIYVAGSQNRIVNSRADLNFCQGLVVNAGSNIITNFHSLRNGQDGSGWPGVTVLGSNNIIAASIVDQSSTGATLTAGFADATAGDTNFNTYSGNLYIGMSSTSPLYSFATAKGAAFTIADKDVITIADGTTQPDVGGHTLFLFGQTTPLSINTINHGVPGQRVCFIGNANVTLTNAGNLYLGGETSEALVANHMYCFRNVENFWYNETTFNNPIFGTPTVTSINANFLVGQLAAPAAVVGAGLGAGASVSVSGTAFAGYIQLNSGTGTASGTVATLTFPGTYPYGFKCVFSPANTQGPDGFTKIYWPVSSGTGNAVVAIAAISALPATEAMGFNYICGL